MTRGRQELIGRDRELRALDAVLARLSGPARLVEVVGEPGIGKTALLRALARRADARGLLTLLGRAAEYERELPFAVFVDALDEHLSRLNPRVLSGLTDDERAELARVLPALAGLADASGRALPDERYRAHRAVRALLTVLAARRPLVLCLDDLHWADAASLELLAHLLRRRPAAPVVIAVAYRPGELPDRLRALPDDARTDLDLRLELGPLSRDEADLLVGERVPKRQRAQVYTAAGGVPFYLEELAGAAASGAWGEASDVARGPAAVPPAILDSFARRQSALTPEARTLLHGAAVAGDPFEPRLAAVAAGIATDEALAALDELLARGLVAAADAPQRFRFRHPILRRAAYDSAGRGWRIAAHARLAAALERAGAPPVLRAHHLAHSAQTGDERAAAVLVEAAEAVGSRAPATSADWLEAALALLPSADRATRTQMLVALAAAAGAAGQHERSHAALTEALELLPAEMTPERARLTALCCAVEHALGRHDAAVQRLMRAREQAAALDDAEVLAALEIERAASAVYAADYAQVRAAAARAEAAAARAGDVARVAVAQALECFAAVSLGDPGAELLRARAAASVAALPDEQLAGTPEAVFHLAMAARFSDRFGDAVSLLERALELSRRYGHGQLLAAMRAFLAWALLELGQVGAARAVAEEAIDAARLSGSAVGVGWALWPRAMAAWLAGDTATARRDADEQDRLLESLDATHQSQAARAHFALLRLELGDPDGCLRGLARAGAPELSEFAAERRPVLCEAAARACLALGRGDKTGEWVQRAEAFAAGLGFPLAAGAALRARAALLLAGGDCAQAAELALEAAAVEAGCGAAIAAARSRILAGRALAAAGERDGAVAVLEAAHDALEAAGAALLRDEAARELRRLGRRMPRPAGRPAGGAGRPTGSPGADGELAALTARELEIARLVAAGRSNKEIAATLHLSVRTVENHLRRVFAKLSVPNRAGLAARVAATSGRDESAG